MNPGWGTPMAAHAGGRSPKGPDAARILWDVQLCLEVAAPLQAALRHAPGESAWSGLVHGANQLGVQVLQQHLPRARALLNLAVALEVRGRLLCGCWPLNAPGALAVARAN